MLYFSHTYIYIYHYDNKFVNKFYIYVQCLPIHFHIFFIVSQYSPKAPSIASGHQARRPTKGTSTYTCRGDEISM